MKRQEYLSWDDYFMAVALLWEKEVKIQVLKLVHA